MDSSDARGVVLINPLSGFGFNSDSLDVDNNIGFRREHVKVVDLVRGVGCNSDYLDVCDDISSRIEQIMFEGPIDLEDDNVPCILHRSASVERRQ